MNVNPVPVHMVHARILLTATLVRVMMATLGPTVKQVYDINMCFIII